MGRVEQQQTALVGVSAIRVRVLGLGLGSGGGDGAVGGAFGTGGWQPGPVCM